MPDVDLVVSALTKLTTSAPPVLLFFGLIGFGYLWKVIPCYPNSRIPLGNLIVAMVLYPFIAKANLNETYSMRLPWVGALVRDEIAAICVFAAAWLFHRLILKRFLDKWIPQHTNGNGDTKFFVKGPLTPPPDSGTKPP